MQQYASLCVSVYCNFTHLPACLEHAPRCKLQVSTLSTCTVAGLSIEFMGVTYVNNNTEISITEVGEDDSEAVLCKTDLTTCCTRNQSKSSIQQGQGNWKFPSGTVAGNRRSGDNIFRTRGEMVVRLHRRNSTTTPIGQYCCEVPTMANTSSNATICITLCKLYYNHTCHEHAPRCNLQ